MERRRFPKRKGIATFGFASRDEEISVTHRFKGFVVIACLGETSASRRRYNHFEGLVHMVYHHAGQ
jgi:hypothetical protein